MAIEKDITLKNNFSEDSFFKNAYIQVAEISGTKKLLNVKVFIKKQDQVNVLDERVVSFVPSVDDGSKNFIKQAYEHLKTMEEFSNGKDI
jgi:hypothetical protein